MLSDLIKRLLYDSGALGLYHRVRNARTLTVTMFHRVLDPTDPRWNHCDPDYTLRTDLFDECLRFFSAHYTMVSADDVVEARRGRKKLPRCAMLVTFDDGWADNVDYALPRLHARRMPGLMFVVADAIGALGTFYQERIVSAWRRGALTHDALQTALRRFELGTPDPVPPGDGGTASMRRLIGRIENIPAESRERLLATIEPQLQDESRHMVTADELRLLERGGVAIGVHGKTHIPLTAAIDLDAELSGARKEIGARLAADVLPFAMSFPHGRYDADIADRARQAGFELVFTSVPVVNPTGSSVGWLLGRLGFESEAVTDATGRFRPDLLALYLFRRPHRVLG